MKKQKQKGERVVGRPRKLYRVQRNGGSLKCFEWDDQMEESICVGSISLRDLIEIVKYR